MLMCLDVTETLLYCRPPLALFAVAHWRSRSMSKSSWIRALIHRHNGRVAERKLKQQANHERLGCAQSIQFILWFVQ